MEIKKADSKGRVTVAEDGKVYSVHRDEDGTITMSPISIPEPPIFDKQKDLRAIYVSTGNQISTITIFSAIGSVKQTGDYIAKLANEHLVPVVIDTRGIGVAIADYLVDKLDRDVIGVNAAQKK